VDRTAKELHGRPVVFISDMCAAARTATAGPVMIINADILLRPQFDLAEVARGLADDQVIVARRIDVTDAGSSEGEPCLAGFDLFIAHAHNLSRIPDQGFAVGIPWWDYYVPMMLYASGLRVCVKRDRFAYHLRHELRWDRVSWFKMGTVYGEQLSELFGQNQGVADHGLAANGVGAAAKQAARWSNVVETGHRVHAHVGNWLQNKVNKKLRRSLSKLSHKTIMTIDAHFPEC
jgi:hypothetical protein